MLVIGNGTGTASVVDKEGTVVETFESSGCIYNDLGCCQGCPTCVFEHACDRNDISDDERAWLNRVYDSFEEETEEKE